MLVVVGGLLIVALSVVDRAEAQTSGCATNAERS